MSDTLMRYWQMLRLVPRHPVKVSTAERKQCLADEGFDSRAIDITLVCI